MPVPSITEFAVAKLHGIRSFRIPIRDNRLVLTGHNGLGKSTIITLFYYFLSRQWTRLAEYQFEDISIRIGKSRRKITGREIKQYAVTFARDSFIFRYAPREVYDRVRLIPQEERQMLIAKLPMQSTEQRRLADRHNIPFQFLERLSFEIRHRPELKAYLTEKTALFDLDHALAEEISAQILFLPTYRRIEKDLESVVPELREHIRRINEQAEKEKPKSGQGHLELVQFGMEDVERNVRQALGQLKEAARAELNSLAGSYLRDVIRHEANRYEPSSIRDLDDSAISRIINRVEERTLSQDDKTSLYDSITRIRRQALSEISENDKYVAHFVSQLARLDMTIASRERGIKEFAAVCNSYLIGKEFIYDDANFSLSLIDKAAGDNVRPIELSMLSSGEKQIVSIFSHIYLSEGQDFVIIIDEPELSLSVDWQTKLLPDIAKAPHVKMISAVTHSPFVFDNLFEVYTSDIAAFINA